MQRVAGEGYPLLARDFPWASSAALMIPTAFGPTPWSARSWASENRVT